MPAAIDFQAEHDWPRVSASQVSCAARSPALRDRLPLEPLTDDFVQMLGFALPEGTDGEALKVRPLYDRAPHRGADVDSGSTMRVSVQGYNDEADADALLAALH